MWVQTDGNGRITATTEHECYASEDMFSYEFPDGFDFEKQGEYTIKDGVLTHEPAPPTDAERIAELQKLLEDSDHIPLKMIESQLSGVPLSDDESERYAAIIDNRRAWRAELDALLDE